MDLTLNGYNSERFPPINKNLAYYYPLDETLQCCVQKFQYIDALCVRNLKAADGDLYKKFFLDLGVNTKIAYVDYDNFDISTDMFKEGQYNVITIDAQGYDISKNFKKLLTNFSKQHQVPILVLNDKEIDDDYNTAGVSVLYFTEIPLNEVLLDYIEKGIRYLQAYNYTLYTDYIAVKDYVVFPIHSNISNFTISINVRINTEENNNLLFSVENDNRIACFLYNKERKELKIRFKQEDVTCNVDLEKNKFYKFTITKNNRLFKIYLNGKKIIDYQYDIPIKASKIILGCSGNLGYEHISNNFYRDCWIYSDCKNSDDIEILNKSILTML